MDGATTPVKKTMEPRRIEENSVVRLSMITTFAQAADSRQYFGIIRQHELKFAEFTSVFVQMISGEGDLTT
jgi:hypothetical protein